MYIWKKERMCIILMLLLKLLSEEFAIFIIVVKRTFWSDASVELIRWDRWKGLTKEKQREGECASPKGTIRESFGVSIGVLVQVDSCDSETHCPDCGGSEFLILNKTDLALHRSNGSEILAVAILGAIRFSSQIVKLEGLAQDDFWQRKYSICYIVDDEKKINRRIYKFLCTTLIHASILPYFFLFYLYLWIYWHYHIFSFTYVFFNISSYIWMALIPLWTLIYLQQSI